VSPAIGATSHPIRSHSLTGLSNRQRALVSMEVVQLPGAALGAFSFLLPLSGGKNQDRFPKWNRNSNGCQMPQSAFAICRQSIWHEHSYLCMSMASWMLLLPDSHCHANLCQIQRHLCPKGGETILRNVLFFSVMHF